MSMELQLLDQDGKLVTGMDNDGAMLGSYPIEDDMKIYVSLMFFLEEYFIVFSNIQTLYRLYMYVNVHIVLI